MFFSFVMEILNQTQDQTSYKNPLLSAIGILIVYLFITFWNLHRESIYFHLQTRFHMLLRKISGFFNTWQSDRNRWIHFSSCRHCTYYKESLPVRVISLPYLKEALLLEMSYNNEKVIVSVIASLAKMMVNLIYFCLILRNFEKVT